MKNLITIGLPSKGRLKDKAVNFFDERNNTEWLETISMLVEGVGLQILA